MCEVSVGQNARPWVKYLFESGQHSGIIPTLQLRKLRPGTRQCVPEPTLLAPRRLGIGLGMGMGQGLLSAA